MASSVCSHVKVVVRVRPTSDTERRENCRNVVQVVDNHMLIFDPKEEDTSCFGSQRLRNRNINKRANKDLKFVFDKVFGEHSTQADIFENTTKGVLDSVMNGFNCTVFAYGATGAGKTHTMLGSQNDPGVMYRTMTELFKRMDDAKEEKEFAVAFSYLEVYNEQIRDLLANAGPLAVREDSSKGVVVQGLTLHQPKSAAHILEALDSGNRNRTQHPTDMNATSSRSHAVFQLRLSHCRGTTMASSVCSHVKVVVRVRPTSDTERRENCRNVVQVVDNHMLIFDPKEEDTSCFGSQRLRNRNINKRANKDLKFVFDKVFGEHSTQADIFENTTKGVLDSVMNGFNCTVFAYGATGAGKTHTMLGSQNDPGVMYRTMTELFKRMDDAKEEKEFAVAFSYLEVYNEQIRDLLANAGPLAVREDSSKGVVVQGLTLHQPKSAAHILEALDSGNRNRTQHPTDMNATSSRSHAVFQIYLRQQDKTANLNPNICVAKMSLIDLAGSERASTTNAKGARLREGANINRSLLALGNVINALADPKSKKTHIPYRDSKLTRLLKDSLGGNCRTVMIANVSPSSKSYDDTHNTLKYANRAKEIKSTLKSNVVSLDSHISQYAVICEKQRQEILQLKQKLKAYEDLNTVPETSSMASSQTQAEFKRVSETLQQIFSGRAQIRGEQLDLERQLKENELRQRYSEEDNLLVQYFCAKEKTEKATCKHERKIASLRTQHQHICKRLKESETQFLENDGWLHRVENDIKLLKTNDQTSVLLEKDLHCHRLELQVHDFKQHIKQMVKLAAQQDQENKRIQKMVNILLPAYSRNYSVLHGAGLVTAADEQENHELEHLVFRERGVVWADQEGAGLLKGDGIGAESQETNEVGIVGLRSELAPVLSFSHLLYHQNSPCSAEGRTKRATLYKTAPSLKGSGNQTEMMKEPAPRMPIRRNLCVSLPPQSPRTVAAAQVFEDGMFPLQCTPDPAQKTLPLGSSSTMDHNMTFEVLDNDEQTADNATIIISSGSPCQAYKPTNFSGPSQPLHLPKANVGIQIPTKSEKLLSLQDIRRTNPTYMDMTSAAQGKRKFNRGIQALTQDFSAPKRMKKDPSMSRRPLRVQRLAGSEESRPQRVVRCVSEGNLSLLEPQKSKSIFYKTSQHFKRVTKRM